MACTNEQQERNMVASLVGRQERRMYPRARDRVLVCLTGVVNRSIRYTWPSIEDHIVKPLRSRYTVDLAIFNNNVEDSRVDGETLNNADLAIVPHDHLFEYKQSDLDKEVERLPGFATFRDRIDVKKRNGFRQMCIDRKVAEAVEKSETTYHRIVVTNADYFYVSKLPLDALSSLGSSQILSCHHHDCGGYTDGFYAGDSTSICQIMGRVSRYSDLAAAPQHNGDWPNYETVLKRSFLASKIERIKVDMPFVKIRANLTVPIEPPGNRRRLRKFLEEHGHEHHAYRILLQEDLRQRPHWSG